MAQLMGFQRGWGPAFKRNFVDDEQKKNGKIFPNKGHRTPLSNLSLKAAANHHRNNLAVLQSQMDSYLDKYSRNFFV